jgi:hypothetical protein
VPNAPDFTLREACDQLVCFTLPVSSGLTENLQLAIMVEAPEMQGQMVSSHGLLAILEVLESKPARDVILRLLQIVNLVCLKYFSIRITEESLPFNSWLRVTWVF